jgi:glycine cleavage system aminomethyltransferase T
MPSEQYHPYKVSAAYHAQVALNATWTELDGWRMPETFGDPAEEAARIRSAVGLQDVSPFGKLDVKGSAIDGRVSQCERLEGVLAALLQKPGHALVLTAPRRESMVRDALAGVFAGSPGCVHITDVTSALTAFALVGPRATELLAGLTSIDLRPRTLGDRTSATCNLAHVHATIYRSDWGEVPAYLVLVGREVGEYVWSTIQHAGEKVGLTPFGTAAERLLYDALVRPHEQDVTVKT